jgi:hypothetical protein
MFQLIFGWAEEAHGAGSSLRHRLARSPDPNWTPESAESEAAVQKRLVRMVPGSGDLLDNLCTGKAKRSEARDWIAVNVVQ